jgi:hypothetical protein
MEPQNPFLPDSGPQPHEEDSPRVPPALRSGAANKPRVRLAATAGEGVPLGASLTPPVPAALPDRGATGFFVISLVTALVAVSFTLLIAAKL